MQEMEIKNEQPLYISDLYPDLTEEQQQESAYYLARYLEVVQRIYERRAKLTDSDQTDTMQ